MLSSLKKFVTHSDDIQYILHTAKINSKKDLIKIDKLKPLLKKIIQPKNCKKLIDHIRILLKSNHFIQKIKVLCLLHYLLQQSNQPEVLDFITQQLYHDKCESCQDYDDVEQYFFKFLINPEKIYLAKLALKRETYHYAKNFQYLQDKENLVQIVSHGFKALNLSNTILQMVDVFHKLGRFYLDHQEAISLFLLYLQDLKVFNDFIKNVARIIVKDPEHNNPEELKHNFVFLTEAQKISDRLPQFFYNRYYFPWTQKSFQMPTFMMVNIQSFEKVRKAVKKCDYGLVKLIKKSTKGQNNCLNQTHYIRCGSQIKQIENSINYLENINKTSIGFRHLLELPQVQQLQIQIGYQQQFTNEGYLCQKSPTKSNEIDKMNELFQQIKDF